MVALHVHRLCFAEKKGYRKNRVYVVPFAKVFPYICIYIQEDAVLWEIKRQHAAAAARDLIVQIGGLLLAAALAIEFEGVLTTTV